MYKAPRGTADILPEAQPQWEYVRTRAARVAEMYGYRRIDTPIFEETNLFQRTVGEESDIVQKEMYTFIDRGEQSLTLRPEGTAAVCRAYLEHGMHNLLQPVRLYYVCPMFRYDRPQAGRFRQFHQFGVEAIGDSDPAVDLEVLLLAMQIMESIGLGRMNLVLNNIGDPDDRAPYLDALRGYYASHIDHLCADCKRRHQRNPLRMLDCKQASCQPYLEGAPRSADYLGAEAKGHWDELLGYLETLGVKYRLDHRLVRGLDYYTRTVFEVHPAAEGAQSAVCAGGRYDGLMEELGGRPTPGIGFAAGIERLILNMQREGANVPELPPSPVVVAFSGNQAKAKAIELVSTLRSRDIASVVAPSRSLKAQMRFASGSGARHVLIVGERELAGGTVTVRDLATGQQQERTLEEALRIFALA